MSSKPDREYVLQAQNIRVSLVEADHPVILSGEWYNAFPIDFILRTSMSSRQALSISDKEFLTMVAFGEFVLDPCLQPVAIMIAADSTHSILDAARSRPFTVSHGDMAYVVIDGVGWETGATCVARRNFIHMKAKEACFFLFEQSSFRNLKPFSNLEYMAKNFWLREGF